MTPKPSAPHKATTGGAGNPASGATGPSSGGAGGSVRGASTRASIPGASTASCPLGDLAIESWEFWWEANKDSLLPLPATHAATPRTRSGGATPANGETPATASPEPATLGSRVQPALYSVLSNEHEAELVDSAVLALARVTPPTGAGEAADGIRLGLHHDALSVRTSATLSLGVLGAPRSLPLLNALMIDSPAGRQSLGGGAVPWQVRSHAAIALGLVNEPLAVDALLDVAAHSPAAQRELRTAAIVALGLMHNVRTPDIVKALLALLETPKLDSVVGAYIPTSLAKLGDASLVPHLLDLYRAHDTDQAVRQSLAIALGRLGHLAQDPVVDALMDSVLKESDAGTRHFATMALGRLGADAADRELPVARRRLETFLQRQVSTPSHRTDVGWSALALAIDARASNATRSTLTDTLVEGYGNERDPSVRGAFALALGLAGAQAVAPQLLDEFRSSSDEAFRGYAAIALGLLRHQDAAAALIPLCGDKTVSDTFRQQVVRGVSLLDAPELTPVLLDALTQARSLPLAWSLGRALGQRRDADSIEPLEKLLADGTRPLAARAFACVALGLVGDKEVLRFNSDIAQDCNYLVRTATMDDILSL